MFGTLRSNFRDVGTDMLCMATAGGFRGNMGDSRHSAPQRALPKYRALQLVRVYYYLITTTWLSRRDVTDCSR